VVVSDNDAKTWAMLEDVSLGHLTLRAVAVTTPGYAAALNAGLDATRGDIITITDDDTAPRPDWLARIENHFQADPRVGGVGGRDWVREVIGSMMNLGWAGAVVRTDSRQPPPGRRSAEGSRYPERR
jgi:cellulose synthase/poly-beta-1,6-N-acetylglucosamine synthase-like glycosyltransferase